MQIAEINPKSAEYPSQLKQIAQPPKLLYVAGKIPLEPAVAIVGSRRPTKYGEDVTYQLAYDLARAGLVIISGLALGVDAIAHRGALDAGGTTVGVLGCGHDINYPASNRYIKERMVEKGAVVSEYPLGTPGIDWHFPARNRIIAGLAQATIVTECAAESGALITAEFAEKFGRMVMAVPGPITSQYSAGPNNLIRTKDAIAVTSSSDILDLLGMPGSAEGTIKADSKEEAAIMDLITRGINTSEMMIRQLDMSASQFAQLISLMEITGKVRNLGAGHWALSR